MTSTPAESSAVPRALVIGDALVDLVISGDADPLAAYPKYGGSAVNVAVGAARLDVPTALAAPLCGDFFGQRLESFLRAEGIDLRYAGRPEGQTCLAVAIREHDNVRFDSFTRPEVLCQVERLPVETVAGTAAVHAGTLALLDDPARSVALEVFGVTGPVKVLDPNPRPAVLSDPAAYRERLAPFLASTDVLKLSADDIAFLYAEEPRRLARTLHDDGVPTIVVTLGAEGAFVVHDGQERTVAAPPIELVDATGAGDALMASVLAAVIDTPPADADGWAAVLERSVCAASLTCGRYGGAEAMPTRRELDAAASERPDTTR